MTIRFAQIDPTSVCDLHCGYCVGRDWQQAHLKAEMFDELVGALPELEYVQLQGEGEPMLGKRFWNHLETLRSTGCEVGFTTNGRHLTGDAVRRLTELGVKSIAVSVDTLDSDLFRRIRHGDLESTIEGIERLLSQRTSGMDVFTTSVLMKSTFPGFTELVSFAERLGMSMPSCQPLQEKSSYVSHYRSLDYSEQALDSEQRRWMIEYAEERSAYRSLRGLQTFYEAVEAAAPRARCAFIEHSVHLRFDGAVFACCFIKEDEFSLGTVDSTSAADLLNAPMRQAMRAEIASGGVPEPCLGCHVLRR